MLPEPKKEWPRMTSVSYEIPICIHGKIHYVSVAWVGHDKHLEAQFSGLSLHVRCHRRFGPSRYLSLVRYKVSLWTIKCSAEPPNPAHKRFHPEQSVIPQRSPSRIVLVLIQTAHVHVPGNGLLPVFHHRRPWEGDGKNVVLPAVIRVK